MTYKSFTTLDEVFDLLVQRFRIQPPEGLNAKELEEWTKLKQHIIQMRYVLVRRLAVHYSDFQYRVLNTFKSMVVDEDVLEKDDIYILDRMRSFITQEEVYQFAAAKVLLTLIERYVRSPPSPNQSVSLITAKAEQGWEREINCSRAKPAHSHTAKDVKAVEASRYRSSGVSEAIDDHGE